MDPAVQGHAGGYLRRGCWRWFVGCSTCSYDPLRSIDAAEPHAEVVLRAAELLDGPAEVLGELAFLGNRQSPAGGIQLFTCGPLRAASSISPLHPVAMAPALLLSGFSPGCHGGEAIAQAATLDLGWKPQDREQLVHQLTQAVRHLLEPFRIPCAQEVSRAPRYQPATRPSCSASA